MLHCRRPSVTLTKATRVFASQLKVLGDGDDPVFLETAVSSASRPSRRRSRSRAKQEGDLHSKTGHG